MAINGPLQCNYKKMAEEADKILQKLQNTKKLHITSLGGTNIEVEVGKQVKFDTDCIIVPPNVYGKPGKFGNLPVGEVWSQKGEVIQVVNNETGKEESQHYPVKQVANGRLVCDIAVGGYRGKINPEKPITVQFRDGVLTDFKCEDRTLDSIKEDIVASQIKYGLPTVLEEVGIGLNEKARITGNMLEDEKIRGTCHLAPGNVRCHVDMLVDKPTITVSYIDGATKEILSSREVLERNGVDARHGYERTHAEHDKGAEQKQDTSLQLGQFACRLCYVRRILLGLFRHVRSCLLLSRRVRRSYKPIPLFCRRPFR